MILATSYVSYPRLLVLCLIHTLISLTCFTTTPISHVLGSRLTNLIALADTHNLRPRLTNLIALFDTHNATRLVIYDSFSEECVVCLRGHTHDDHV